MSTGCGRQSSGLCPFSTTSNKLCILVLHSLTVITVSVASEQRKPFSTFFPTLKMVLYSGIFVVVGAVALATLFTETVLYVWVYRTPSFRAVREQLEAFQQNQECSCWTQAQKQKAGT